MKAVQLRIEIKEHGTRLVKGWHKKAMSATALKGLSTFQQYRRGRILLVAARYFNTNTGIDEIANVIGLTHQRVSAILGDAVTILESEGLIDRGSGVHRPAGKRRAAGQ